MKYNLKLIQVLNMKLNIVTGKDIQKDIQPQPLRQERVEWMMIK